MHIQHANKDTEYALFMYRIYDRMVYSTAMQHIN